MKNSSKKKAKKAMIKIQEAINILEKIKGEHEEFDEAADAVGFAYADLEYEINK